MKKLTQVATLTSIALSAIIGGFLGSAPQAIAVEGLTLSVRSNDVVLTWPCSADTIESFIVQVRTNLESNTPWETLASYCYPDFGTNLAVYVHANAVNSAALGDSSQSSAMLRSDTEVPRSRSPINWEMFSMCNTEEIKEPLVMLADRSGSIVPLELFPPRAEMSGFVIFDPATQNWVSGPVYSNSRAELAASENSPPPLDSNGREESETNAPPVTGFYRVVRMGPSMFGITNGMVVSGMLEIPIEAGWVEGSLVEVAVMEHYLPIGSRSVACAPFNGIPKVRIDTSLMTNGVHEIQVSGTWSMGESGPVVYCGTPVSIVVSNEISFANWVDECNEMYPSLLVQAETPYTSGTWRIDFFDSQTNFIFATSNYLHLSQGRIEFTWSDLKGPAPGYIDYTNEPFFLAQIRIDYVSPSGNPGTVISAKKPILSISDPWSAAGAWVMAANAKWEFWLEGDRLYEALDALPAMAIQRELNVYPPPLAQGVMYRIRAETIDEPVDWQAVRLGLYHQYSRNLFYFGHGTAQSLGSEEATKAGDTTKCIPAEEICRVLSNYKPPFEQNKTNLYSKPHRYRMVIADACLSATGSLPHAFGITSAQNIPAQTFWAAGKRPQAFAGWSKKATLGWRQPGTWGRVDLKHANFILHLEFHLQVGESIDRARRLSMTANDVSYDLEDFIILGCPALGFNDFNYP